MNKYCKAKNGSDLSIRLLELAAKIDNCREEAKSLSLKYSKNKKWVESINPFLYAGGISAFVFNKEPDVKIWKNIPQKGLLYFPSAKTKIGKAILLEVGRLTTISCEEVKDIFKAKQLKGNYIFHPGFHVYNDNAYFNYDDEIWEICDNDIVEITASEYGLILREIK